MSETVAAPPNAAEHLRIGRILESHGHRIGAILAYRLVMEHGAEPGVAFARRRIEELARVAASGPV